MARFLFYFAFFITYWAGYYSAKAGPVIQYPTVDYVAYPAHGECYKVTSVIKNSQGAVFALYEEESCE